MIILDTNVISEAMAVKPAEQVARLLRFAPGDELYTTAITEAEMRYGARRMSLHRKGWELEQGNMHDFEKSGVPLINPWNA